MSQVLGAAVETQSSTNHYILILERILLPVNVSESWTLDLWHSLWSYLTKPRPPQRILSLKVAVLVPRALAERHDDDGDERWFLTPGHSQRLRVLSMMSIGDMQEPKADSATLVEPEWWPSEDSPAPPLSHPGTLSRNEDFKSNFSFLLVDW